MSSTSDSAKKRSPRIRRSLLNISFVVASAALVLLLVAQCLLIPEGSWKVPDSVAARIHDKLEEQGFQANYQALRFRLPGSILAKDLRLTKSSDEEVLASAKLIQADFSFLELLRGNPPIRKITLYGGAFYCPPSLSPTGASERVLEQAHLVVAQDETAWEIRNLNGKLETLAFTASGTFPRLPERPEQPMDWEGLLREVLPRIVRERVNMRRAQNPRLHVRFSGTPGGELTLGVEAWADAIDAPRQVRIVQPYLATNWHYDGLRWNAAGTSFASSSVDWDSQVTARGVTGDLLWPADHAWTPEKLRDFLPQGANLSLARLETPAGSLTEFQVKLAADSETLLTADFFVFFQDGPLEGKSGFDWKDGTGRLEIVSRVNPTPFLQHEIARELGLQRDIFFHEPLFARAEARVEQWRFVDAFALAHAREADIDGVFMNRASARVELRPDRFLVPELVLAYDDFEAYGSYEIDFSTLAYRFLFKGSVRPLHLSAWFEDWWIHLWEEFDFPAGPLQGDVDIHSVLFESEQVELVGSVRAEDFFLRGVPFASVDAKLFVLDNYADIFDVHLTRAEGTASGGFQYWADPATSAFAKLVFEVDSTVDPTDVAQIFEEAGRDILTPFRFSEPPSLAMEGVVFGEARESETLVTLTGKTPAPLEYQNVPLDQLTVEARIEGDAWTLSRLEGGFAGGSFEGHAQKWTEAEDEKLEFALLVRDADLPTTVEAVSRWQAENGIDEVSAGQNVTGIFDLNVEAAGLYGDFQSFFGDGSLQVREADLAEVHLLGLLSRILSVTPLGFTSLQFDEAEARFRLELNRLRVPEFRLTGSTSAISGSGNYLIDQDQLDFLVKLHFLKESKIPFLSLLLSPVLEPLAHVMEMRLTGPVANPDWRFLLGPRNILSGVSLSEEDGAPPGKEE